MLFTIYSNVTQSLDEICAPCISIPKDVKSPENKELAQKIHRK